MRCVDRRQLKAAVRHHVSGLIDETLDEWDDEARWRMLVTRFGKDAIHEAATIAVTKFIDDAFEGIDNAA